MTKDDVYRFMAAEKLGVVGSIGAEGRPQAALVGIAVTRELEIIFDTVKSSRKYWNLSANPAASVVAGWSGEVTVQLEGMAFEPLGMELTRYQEIYFGRWPDGVARLEWPGIVHLVVRPVWVRYSDFGRSPAVVVEFKF